MNDNSQGRGGRGRSGRGRSHNSDNNDNKNNKRRAMMKSTRSNFLKKLQRNWDRMSASLEKLIKLMSL